MQYRYCSHWNPSHMLIIFILYVQSQPQKPKECCMADLKFYYLQRFCHYVISVFTSLDGYWRHLHEDICTDKILREWKTESLAQVRTISVYTTSRFDPGFVLLKSLLVSRLKSVFTVCSVTMCCFKDNLVARNSEVCLHERNKQQEERNP